jgi:Icc protein
VKIIQLTDCHVTAAPDITYRGSDPRATLAAIIDTVLAWQPDLVLATGDFSEDASQASYAFLAEQFARLPVPVLGTPGNHDTAEGVLGCLPHSAIDDPLVYPGSTPGTADPTPEPETQPVEDGWQIILLGSAKPGEIGGRFEARQLDRFEEALARGSGPALVALHHQPWPVGSPWIDRYALAEPERFHALVKAHDRIRLVLWGHVHQAIRLDIGPGQVGLGAPSTVSNSLPGQPRFTIDPAGPACRWLELFPGGEFETGLLRPSTGAG